MSEPNLDDPQLREGFRSFRDAHALSAAEQASDLERIEQRVSSPRNGSWAVGGAGLAMAALAIMVLYKPGADESASSASRIEFSLTYRESPDRKPVRISLSTGTESKEGNAR